MPTTREVIEKCRNTGLVVELNQSAGSHTMWNIIDPKTGTIITGLARNLDSNADPNWFWTVRRLLKRAGFYIEFGPERKKGKRRISHDVRRKGSAVDLKALKVAQEKARAAGVRVPTLEDFDEDISIFKKSHGVYNQQAQDEVITQMAIDRAPLLHLTKTRFEKFLNEKGPAIAQEEQKRRKEETGRGLMASPRSTFIRVAIEEIGPQRGLRTWKTKSSGEQTIMALLQGRPLSLWSINLIQATLDHFEGLRWDVVDETKIKTPEPIAPVIVEASEPIAQDSSYVLELLTEEIDRLEKKIPTMEQILANIDARIPANSNSALQKYADVLLDLLKDQVANVTGDYQAILIRLDKIFGLEI